MEEITFVYNTDEKLEEYEELYLGLLESTKNILNINKTLTLSVTFISKDESLNMNRQYRDRDYIADVISFPIDDDGIYDQLDFQEIGDIFICYEEATNKAEKWEHTIKEEMTWLFVHGLLHILGYDHENNEEEATIMFKLTDEILATKEISYELEKIYA